MSKIYMVRIERCGQTGVNPSWLFHNLRFASELATAINDHIKQKIECVYEFLMAERYAYNQQFESDENLWPKRVTINDLDTLIQEMTLQSTTAFVSTEIPIDDPETPSITQIAEFIQGSYLKDDTTKEMLEICKQLFPETCSTCDDMGARHSGSLCPECEA